MVQDARRDTIFRFLKAAFVMFDKIMIHRPFDAERGKSYLSKEEGIFIKDTFETMRHRKPGRDTKTFTFHDFLSGNVRDPEMTQELLLVKDSGILPCFKITHM